MKKIGVALIAGLVLASNTAIAEWRLYGEGGDLKAYYETESVRARGGTVKVWRIFNYSPPRVEPIGKVHRSSKAQDEYDCHNEAVRTVHAAYYTEEMGKGGVVWSGNLINKEFSPVSPDSIGASLLKIACE